MKTNLLTLLFCHFVILIACKDDSIEEEINPLNRFSYKGQFYQTPRFGMVNTGETTSNNHEFELIFLSQNHNFTAFDGVGYDISGNAGPALFLTIQTLNERHILPATYTFSSNEEEDKLLKAFAVLEYTPPGSFDEMILLSEGQVSISELDGMIEINYEFNSTSPFPLSGYYKTSSEKWYK